MKKRNPAAVLLLPFATLGIYCIYWLYATRKEIVAGTGNPRSIPPVSLLFLPLLLFLAVVIGAIVAGISNGEHRITLGVLAFAVGLIGFIGLFVIPLWWFWRYCKVVTDHIDGMDFAQSYVLCIVIGWVCGLFPVWMLITQLDINKSIEHQTRQHARTS